MAGRSRHSRDESSSRAWVDSTLQEESTSGEEDVFERDTSGDGGAASVGNTSDAAAERRIESELYSRIEALDAHSKIQLLQLLQNAEREMEDKEGTTVGDFLEEVGAEKNREFELFHKNLETLKSFDLLLFRGRDFVSNFIIKLTTKHRGVDFFSHVGICLAPPLLPRNGHYMRRGKSELKAKVLPFVQLRLELRDAQPSADQTVPHELSITVLQCRGLPSRYDEGGSKEDPYVRISLTPYDDAEQRSYATNTSFRTKSVWHGGHNPRFCAYHHNTGVLQLPAAPHPQPPQLRVQVWDEDRISPDDLVGFHYLNVDAQLLQQMASDGMTARWLLLDTVDSVIDGSIYQRIRLPNHHRPEDMTDEEIGRVAREDHEHDLTLGWGPRTFSENHTVAAARRMADFLNDPIAAYMATKAALAGNAAGFHGPSAAGARTASLIAGCGGNRGSWKGGAVIRGNVLMAPMGLDYKALYVEEQQRSIPWQEWCLAAMYTWKYYWFLVILALLTVCTFDAKTMTLTTVVHDIFVGDTSRRNGSKHLRPFGWEWLWQNPVWVEVTDWSLLGFLVLECVVRVACEGLVGFSSSWNNVMDIVFVAVDSVLAMYEHVVWAELNRREYGTGQGFAHSTAEDGHVTEHATNSTHIALVWPTHADTSDERWAWWEQTPPKFMVVAVLRNLKLLRLVPRLLALRKKVKGKKRRDKWGLHEVVARRTKRGIEISWANVVMMERHREAEKRYHAHARGPLLVAIDPSSPAKPATVLDKVTHIDHLERQSEYCFKVPAVSVPENSDEADVRDANRKGGPFVGYLQFDTEKKDVRDAWIEALNDEFKRFIEDEPSSVLANQVRQEQVELERLAEAADTVNLSLLTQQADENRQMGRRFSVMYDAFVKDHGVNLDPAQHHNLSGDLGRLADGATTAVHNERTTSNHRSLRVHDTAGGLSSKSSKSQKDEFKLRERYSDGSPVHYVWEAGASGSIAGTQVLAEESGSGHIGVQIRNLNGVLRDYDGEIAALRLVGAFDKDNSESEQALDRVVLAALGQASGEVMDEVRQLLTRMHEKFYLRNYEVNIFHQLSALYPSLKPIASWCDYLCCCRGRKGSESLFCSQFNADVYQGMGLMCPEVDPSTVLPVDFLPNLSLPGFPRFASEIVPLKVRKNKSGGRYLLAHEEESAAKERWKLSSASVGLIVADRFGEQGGNHHMNKHVRISAQACLQAQQDIASVYRLGQQQDKGTVDRFANIRSSSTTQGRSKKTAVGSGPESRLPKVCFEDSPVHRSSRHTSRRTSDRQDESAETLQRGTNGEPVVGHQSVRGLRAELSRSDPVSPMVERSMHAVSPAPRPRHQRPSAARVPSNGLVVAAASAQILRARAQAVQQSAAKVSPGRLRHGRSQATAPRVQDAVAKRVTLLPGSDTEESEED